jgi:midasin (ATPase involved in ribosome maturation)
MNKESRNLYKREYMRNNPEARAKAAALKAAWYLKNSEAVKARVKENNKSEKSTTARKKWAVENPEKMNSYTRRYRKKNPHVIAACSMRRLIKKRTSTPSWASLEVIKAFYEKAAHLTAISGIKYQVDHIVPILSELVCGLHCEANLQILTSKENRAKSNKYWPDMSEVFE